jgi:hypothetical protein
VFFDSATAFISESASLSGTFSVTRRDSLDWPIDTGLVQATQPASATW